MKKYSIPIIWESYKRYDVEAENLQEAVKEALKQFLKEPDENYLEDRFSIDHDDEGLHGESFDIHKAYNVL